MGHISPFIQREMGGSEYIMLEWTVPELFNNEKVKNVESIITIRDYSRKAVYNSLRKLSQLNQIEARRISHDNRENKRGGGSQYHYSCSILSQSVSASGYFNPSKREGETSINVKMELIHAALLEYNNMTRVVLDLMLDIDDDDIRKIVSSLRDNIKSWPIEFFEWLEANFDIRMKSKKEPGFPPGPSFSLGDGKLDVKFHPQIKEEIENPSG
jgi:hypothetical protein